MGRFKHANVMGLIGVCLNAGTAPLIIMPYMENGSLLKYLKSERDNLIVSANNDADEVSSLSNNNILNASIFYNAAYFYSVTRFKRFVSVYWQSVAR